MLPHDGRREYLTRRELGRCGYRCAASRRWMVEGDTPSCFAAWRTLRPTTVASRSLLTSSTGRPRRVPCARTRASPSFACCNPRPFELGNGSQNVHLQPTGLAGPDGAPVGAPVHTAGDGFSTKLE